MWQYGQMKTTIEIPDLLFRKAKSKWMRGFGKLRRLRKETKRIQTRIDRAFEVIEPEDRT
jgi:hypothetical protein